MVLDIDHFKRFNDSHGHALGDLLLRAAACSLADDERFFAARFGGDEFVVLAKGVGASDAFAYFNRFSARFKAAQAEFPAAVPEAHASAGFYTAVPAPQQEIQTMFDWADQALYTAKRARGRCMNYSDIPAEG